MARGCAGSVLTVRLRYAPRGTPRVAESCDGRCSTFDLRNRADLIRTTVQVVSLLQRPSDDRSDRARMRPVKPLDFERHVKAITTVAGVKLAPEQLSLEERIAGREHDFDSIFGDQWSYTANCKCGWSSRGMVSRDDARLEYRKHLTRTPQGAALIATLRRVGRSSNGS